MKYDHQKAFPYPVLRPDVDDYIEGEFQSTIDVEGQDDGSMLEFTAHFALSVKEITKAIAKDNARYMMLISCRDTYYREKFLTKKNTIAKKISSSLLRGEVQIDSFVVTVKRS
ncbi:MAG: hypothetical protein U5P41_15575 [Gammaproteobacteria bacterium]|nr:hypothetical protein [Gammaproteobacteria bacterium]